MHVEIRAKSKKGVGWESVPLADFQGETLREVLAGMESKQIVTEIVIDTYKYYCCGDASLIEMMSARGRAASCQDTAKALDLISSRILDIRMGHSVIEEIYAGSELEEVIANIADSEEQPSSA